jgi:hypothetical protein
VGAIAAALYLAGAPHPALLLFVLFVAFPCFVSGCALIYLVSEIIHARA